MNKTTEINTARKSFSQELDKHQLAWDSTSLGALKRCPRYYQYNIIEGYVSRSESVHLRFGSEYNNALVTYHKARAKGEDHEQATLTAIRYALEHTWDDTLNRPWTSDEPTKNRETLIRTIIWYLDNFANDSLQTQVFSNGEPAVELSFRIQLDMDSGLTGESYLLCGYLDRFVDFNGGSWITDWKTTKYQLDEKYFHRYSPDNQVSQYDFAGTIIWNKPIEGVIIDAVQLGVTFSRFQRSNIKRTAMQREEWLNDSKQYILQNEQYVLNNYWPQNDTSCEKYGGCPYRAICSASPEIRPTLLKGLFTQRSWDPLLVREI
jgi:hypothetical protein